MKTLIFGDAKLATLAGPARSRVGSEMREIGLIQNGALLVEDGKLAAAGPYDEVRRLAGDDCEEVQVGGRIITPGLVDAHSHPVFVGSRLDDFERRIQGLSYEEIALRGGGIRSTIRQTQGSGVTSLAEAARANLMRMTANGTLAFEAKSGYGGDVEAELNALKALSVLREEDRLKIVPTLLGAHSIPQGFTSSAFAQVVANEMIPAAASARLARYVDVFVEEGYYTCEDARIIAKQAKRHGLGLRLHVDQLRDGGGAALAAELGATTADHLEHVSDHGIQALKEAGVIPVLLPGSVFFLGSRQYPPARKMIDAGLPVVVATDFNPGSSPVESLLSAMNMACTQMGMLPSEALASCTVNAAYSVGLGSQIGSLETGKSADFVVWDADDYRELAYWVGRRFVFQAWLNGERLKPPQDRVGIPTA